MIKEIIKKVLVSLNPNYYLRVRAQRAGNFVEEVKILKNLCKKSKTSIDVGASDGCYSYLMLEYSKNVIAFEPLKEKYDILRFLFRNKSNFQVHNCALSEKNSELSLRIPRGDSGRSTLEESNRLSDIGSKIESRIVEVRTLDEFNLKDIGFIKIDVEGHEESVLLGASGLLEDSKPVLLVEIEERHKPGSVASVVQLLRQSDYYCYFFHNGKIKSFDQFEYDKYHQYGNERYVNNFIFTTSREDIVD